MVSILILSGCSSTQSNDEPDTDGNTESVNSINDADSVKKSEIAAANIDAIITIEGGKIEPSEFEVPFREINILVINKESTPQRIRIPFYEATVAVDVPANGEGYITVEPNYAGRVAVELNGAKLGGVTVVEE